MCACSAAELVLHREENDERPPTRNELAARSNPAGTQRGVSPPCGFRACAGKTVRDARVMTGPAQPGPSGLRIKSAMTV